MTTAKATVQAHHTTTSHHLRLADIFDPAFITYFVAGGAAGAASRTVVSPLERLKIIQQVQQKTSGARYDGIVTSLVRMWKEEPYGRGWFRGNGINCVRIVPYSAVQFCTYEKLKQMFTHDHALDTPRRLAAGALAGITSVCSTYPLDLVRSRLSLATAAISQSSTSSLYTAQEMTMWGMTLKVFREEGGLRGLYRGVISTAVGVAPYVGCNFAVYGALRDVMTPPDKTTVPRKLLCGALAGSISQTITYPFDVIRRKMQVVGMKSEIYGPKYTSGVGAVIGIFKAEGLRGLYRGISANLLKVAPSISTSFFVYEWVRDALQDDHHDDP